MSSYGFSLAWYDFSFNDPKKVKPGQKINGKKSSL